MLRILLAGGGTLGSVSPLIAIKETFPEADYLFVGTAKGPESAFVHDHGIRFRAIGTSKLRRYLSIGNLIDLLKFPFIVVQALRILRDYRPHLILTSGGFVSVPVALAGRLYGSRIFMHQQDIRIGLANKLMRHLATVITTTFEEQLRYFPRQKAYWTGNPVRPLHRSGHTEKR